MTFDRQSAVLVTIGTTFLVFAGCVFYFALRVQLSAVIAAGIFVAGLLFERDRIEAIRDFFF